MLALRAYRLDRPLEVPYADAYGGCSSWVDIEGEVPEPTDGRPALSDVAFGARLQGVLAKLPEEAA